MFKLAHRSLRKSKRYFAKTYWLQCILKDDEWAFVKLVYGQKKWLSSWRESNPQPSDVKRAVYYIPYVMEYDSYSMIFVVFHFLRLDPTAKVVFYEYCQCLWLNIYPCKALSLNLTTFTDTWKEIRLHACICRRWYWRSFLSISA